MMLMEITPLVPLILRGILKERILILRGDGYRKNHYLRRGIFILREESLC